MQRPRARRSPAALEGVGAPAVGLNAIFLLFMSRKSQASGIVLPPLGTLVRPKKVAPAGREEHGQEADAGSGSLTALAQSLQRAEALLGRCIHPSLLCWRALRPRGGPDDTEEEAAEEGASLEGLAHVAHVERSFLALSRSLCVQEDPRTETFQGHVRPAATQGSFSYHPAWTRVARHSATLHALLRQQHHLRLCRHYSRRLKAASDFVRRLRQAEHSLLSRGRQEPCWGHQLRGLCEELRLHTTHWDGLRRLLRTDPWLLPLLLQGHEAVLHMKQTLCSLALHALRLSERCLEVQLRCLAHTNCLDPASLSSFFQGLDIFNQVVKDWAQQRFSVVLRANQGTSSDPQEAPSGGPSAFPTERVLAILAAKRGQLAAQKLLLLLFRLQAGASRVEAMPWEGNAEPWLLLGPPRQAGEGPSSFIAELQTLCQAEEANLLPLLGGLVASTAHACHHVLSQPQQEEPLMCPASHPVSPPAGRTVRWLDASYSEAAAVLYQQYRPLFGSAMATCLAHQLELCSPLAQFQVEMLTTLGQQLGQAVSPACSPQESPGSLRAPLRRLLTRAVLQHWDRDFCQALGSSLTDKCVPLPSQSMEATCSPTAWVLRSLFEPLAFSLRCLSVWSPVSAGDAPPAPAGCRLLLLALSAATSQASCYWVLSKSQQFLASSSLSPFLLVAWGDLQLLKAEASRMAALVSTASSGGRREPHALVWQQEQELSRKLHSVATSMQHFAEDVPTLFSSECKRLSAEVFEQTMPLGKHWRLTLQPDVPSSPSEYASAAAQAVVGQALQAIQLLPREAREPALSQVITAFLEAWMDHILAQKIKFSLHGALQLKEDFNLARELLLSEESGLSAENRQQVLSLRVFQQVDSAVTCLLQQPSKASLPLHTWGALCRHCCSYNGVHSQESGPGHLNSLESLEGLPPQARAAGQRRAGDLLKAHGGGSRSPEDYLSPLQQEWLALRLHGGRRWKVPALPCICKTIEP